MTFLRIVLFSVGLMFAVTWLTNILPQMQSNPPDDEEPVIAGDIDMTGMIAAGDKLFSGKGTCTLCHNALGRAPDLLAMDLNAAFAERLADARYEGTAKEQEGGKSFETYIMESMTDPSAYVVSGFGKKGSNDTVSPMPIISNAPISLGPTEMNMVTAYLQDLAGVEPTVALPSAEDAPVADDDDEEEGGPAETAEEAIENYGCSTCHDLFDSEADMGPKLNDVATRMSREEVRTAILRPNDTIADGFEEGAMPDTFGEDMTAGELEMIIDHLMGLKE